SASAAGGRAARARRDPGDRGVAAASLSRAFRRDRRRQRVAEPFDRARGASQAPHARARRGPCRHDAARSSSHARKARRGHRKASRILAHVVLARRDGARALGRPQYPAVRVTITPRAKLVMLASLFALPIAASFFVYHNVPTAPTANYGELLLPPWRLPEH